MSAPVTLYSQDGKRSREIAAVDAPGWIKAGWSRIPVVNLGEIATLSHDETESSQGGQLLRGDAKSDGVSPSEATGAVLIIAAPNPPVVSAQTKSKKIGILPAINGENS